MSACDRDRVITQKNDAARATYIQQLLNIGFTIRRWQDVAEQRRELKLLLGDADFLKDIGVSQGDAMFEANRPFWQQ